MPVTSPFHARSTALDVVSGLDLTGRSAIVTGGGAGIGLETARALASAGARVTLAVRNAEQGRASAERLRAETGNSAIDVGMLDLADLPGVRRFAASWGDRPLHLLINNAGVMACPLTRTPQGWESQFATNHLGHFALTNLLWPALSAGSGARVVSLSSTGHKISPIRFDDINFETGYNKWTAYGQAKTANALFAVQLDALGRGAGVRAFAVHPGGIMTELQRHLPREEMIAAGWMDEAGNVDARFKTPAQGAATSVWAATSPALDGMGGVYCEDCDIAEPTAEGSPEVRIRGVNAHAVDRADAARLWTLSAGLTGINAFG